MFTAVRLDFASNNSSVREFQVHFYFPDSNEYENKSAGMASTFLKVNIRDL